MGAADWHDYGNSIGMGPGGRGHKGDKEVQGYSMGTDMVRILTLM